MRALLFALLISFIPTVHAADDCSDWLEESVLERTFRIAIPQNELVRNPLPAGLHPNKRLLFEKLQNARIVFAEDIGMQKFRLREDGVRDALLDGPAASVQIEGVESVFDYTPDDADEVHVYLNFADANIFGYWATALFAQDEVQVAEHPFLALLRLQLERSTPEALHLDTRAGEVALITNVPREAAIDIGPLYGHAFAGASPELLDTSTRLLDPPTRSHILAMAALQIAPGMEGDYYSLEDLRFHLDTAITGFVAAKEFARASGRKVVLHTGAWGSGSFGNNPVALTLLQILAARIAGVDRLIYHSVADKNAADFASALALQAKIEAALGKETKPVRARDYLHRIYGLILPYGRGNGT